MWTGHRPLWRNGKSGLASSSNEAQSPCVREESPDFRHGEYVKKQPTRMADQLAAAQEQVAANHNIKQPEPERSIPSSR